MLKNNIQEIITLLIVLTSLIVTGTIALAPIFDLVPDLSLSGYMDYLAKVASIFLPLLGYITGYYYGKKSQKTTP